MCAQPMFDNLNDIAIVDILLWFRLQYPLLQYKQFCYNLCYASM